MKIIEVDEKVTLGEQLQQDIGTVIQISTYTVNPKDIDQFLRTWASVAEITKNSLQGSYQHNFTAVLLVAVSLWLPCF
jgi:hypothetical protein